MYLHSLLEALLRLFRGCQVWYKWQPGSPIVLSNYSATKPHHQPYRQQRNHRQC
jgi:hypothetical protein